MRIALVLCMFLALGTFASIAQDTKIDFSGTWILDAEKSQLGDGQGGRGRGMASARMIVQQEKNKLVVESFRKNREGVETSSVATYTLDGKKCENKVMDRVSTSTAEWSEDGKSLLIQTDMVFTRNEEEIKIHSESAWSLEKGELTLDSTRESPMGQSTSKAVYKPEIK